MIRDDPFVRASAAGTLVFGVAAALGVAFPDAVGSVTVGVSLVLFVAGCVAFAAGFLAGVERSRTEVVDMAGLFFLTGSAPVPVRRALRLLVLVEVVVAVTAASLRPFTESAFGVLVPVYGLGLMAWWAGRNGRFAARDSDPGHGE